MEREEWVIRHRKGNNRVREKSEKGEDVKQVVRMKGRGEYGVQHDKKCSLVKCSGMCCCVRTCIVRTLPSHC